VSTEYGRKSRSRRVWRWICGVKRKPKAVNKPLPYFIVHELDKPGNSATVSSFTPNESLLKLFTAASTGTAQAVALLKTVSCPVSLIRFNHGVGILQLLSFILIFYA